MTRKEVDLIPSELRAIEIHKYYLSQTEGGEVTLEEAIVDFLINYEADFLRKKQLEDVEVQKEEILKYKWIESEKEGHDIGTEKAAMEWVEKYGSIWREERESLEKNEFLELTVVIENRNGIKMEMAQLADIAHNCDCDLYIHKERMKYYNFMLFGKKEYLNVKSILCPEYLETVRGEKIEFIATGNGARRAFEEVERFIHYSAL
ncbi:MAG: HPr family phosphocarrier protein [Proteobacteria bacterium]|nr:HPr family phosphocarrier protein [Pseudomonadota bacterium]